MRVKKLQQLIDENRYVVYIDDSFEWKKQALEYCIGCSAVAVITDEYVYNLHNMYDYSGRFVVRAENSQYGSIWNYVINGMMSVQEALECIFKMN